MTRNRSRKATRADKRKGNLRVWSDNDRFQLLAYLNWCAQYSVDFKSTAIDHLRASTGTEFTNRQIVDKVKREWSKLGQDHTNFEDVFTQGTAALKPLAPADEHAVQQLMARIPPPTRQRHLRSASTRTNSTRGSRGVAPKPQNQLSTQDTLIYESIEQPSLGLMQHVNEGQLTPPVPLKTKDRKRSKTTRQMFRPPPQHSFESDIYTFNGSSATEDESDLSSIRSSACPSVKFYTPQPEMEESNEEMPTPILTPRLPSDSQQDMEATRAELLHYKGCVFNLRNRLSEIDIEMQELQRSSQATGVDCFTLYQQISTLRAQVAEKDLLWKRISAYDTGHLGLSIHGLAMEYNALRYEINDNCSFICQMEADEFINEGFVEFCQMAQSWSLRASGFGFRELLGYCCAANIPMYKLLPALVAAGISELVFEHVCPDILALDSPLLNEYRKHILTKDGLAALHQLDTISLKSLISYENFESETVATEATKLSETILYVLNFFLPTGSCFQSQSQERNEDDELFVSELAKTLARFLLFRVNLALSGQHFKFYFFRPGETFHPTIMEQDKQLLSSDARTTIARKREKQHAVPPPKVRLCLLPALFTSSGNDQHGDNMQGRSVELPTRYHDGITMASPDELPSLNLIAKGVVILA